MYFVTKWFPKEQAVASMAATIESRSADAIFKALADPTRREILSLLRGGRYSVGEIASNFHVSRPAISKHLRLLKSAGLIKDTPEGTARMCELNADPLRKIDSWLKQYEQFWDSSLKKLKAHVESKAK